MLGTPLFEGCSKLIVSKAAPKPGQKLVAKTGARIFAIWLCVKTIPKHFGASSSATYGASSGTICVHGFWDFCLNAKWDWVWGKKRKTCLRHFCTPFLPDDSRSWFGERPQDLGYSAIMSHYITLLAAVLDASHRANRCGTSSWLTVAVLVCQMSLAKPSM